MTPRPRKWLVLVALLFLFAAPFLTAYVLNKAGWRPPPTRNYGELVTPAQDLAGARLVLADGTSLQWRSRQWSWTIFAVTGPDCRTQCIARIDELRRMRISMNDMAERVRVIVVGAELPPEVMARLAPVGSVRDETGVLANLRPSAADDVAAGIADPRGFLIMRYAPGYDASRMRKDLARLLKT